MRSVGEQPSAADSLGINVYLIRFTYVIFGGAMSGFAGATMSLITDPGWVDGKTSGMGWIAVALVIFAAWDPMRGMNRKSTRLNSSHLGISYAVFCLKKKKSNKHIL